MNTLHSYSNLHFCLSFHFIAKHFITSLAITYTCTLIRFCKSKQSHVTCILTRGQKKDPCHFSRSLNEQLTTAVHGANHSQFHELIFATTVTRFTDCHGLFFSDLYLLKMHVARLILLQQKQITVQVIDN